MDTNTQNSSGASNASDFQPPTTNPQQATPNLQTTQGLQQDKTVNGSQDQFNTKPKNPLRVETAAESNSTIPASVNVPSSGLGFWPGLGLTILFIVVVALIYRRWNVYGEPKETVPPVDEEKVVTQKPKKKKAPNKTPKKKGKKKSKK